MTRERLIDNLDRWRAVGGVRQRWDSVTCRYDVELDMMLYIYADVEILRLYPDCDWNRYALFNCNLKLLEKLLKGMNDTGRFTGEFNPKITSSKWYYADHTPTIHSLEYIIPWCINWRHSYEQIKLLREYPEIMKFALREIKNIGIKYFHTSIDDIRGLWNEYLPDEVFPEL